MSTSTLTIQRDQPTLLSRLADYIELSKPKISVLLLVAVAVSYGVARWGQPDPLVLMHTLIGTLLVAASASSLNQLLERRADALMERTAGRPLPAGRLTVREVAWFATLTMFGGSVYLFSLVGWQPALWAGLTWVTYVWIYTPLKSVTWMNTAVGAVSGALPVLIGWSAGGSYDLRAGSLFLLMFLWQFPHFMAIAWLYRHQYGRAGMKMLPVVDEGGRHAGAQAVLAALALIPVSLIPAMSVPGVGIVAYAVLVLILGGVQLVIAWRFLHDQRESTARNLLRISLIYLPAVLLLMLLVPWL